MLVLRVKWTVSIDERTVSRFWRKITRLEIRSCSLSGKGSGRAQHAAATIGRFGAASNSGTEDVFSILPLRNTCFADAAGSDQKPTIARGFSFSEAFGVGGWWDSSGWSGKGDLRAETDGFPRCQMEPAWLQEPAPC